MALLGKEELAPYWRHLVQDVANGLRKQERYQKYSDEDIFNLSPTLEIAKRHQDPTVPHDAAEKLQLEEYIARASLLARPIEFEKFGVNADLYRPLVLHEIRVLELHPGQPEEPLRGNLHHIDIGFQIQGRLSTPYGVSFTEGKAVCYTALSYVWGSPVAEDVIAFGDNALAITKSLGICLRHLRSESNAVMLWVDQICINQRDTKDKEQQVLLMKTIYSQAFNTVIWLGPEPDHGALSLLDMINGSTYTYVDDLSQDERDTFAEQTFGNTEMGSALYNLFCRPWFTRTWTIQEAVLSRDQYLMSGKSAVTWEQFANFRVLHDLGIMERFSEGHSNQELADRGQAAACQLIDLIRARFQFRRNGQLIRVLADTRYADVTIPVDKLYGILGLCEQQIFPDYSQSATDVLRECTIAEMRRILDNMKRMISERDRMMSAWHETVSVLCCVDHDPHHCATLPSWIPDWSKPRLTHSLGYTTHDTAIYRAGGPMRHTDDIKLSHDGCTLQVYAHVFDIAHVVSQVLVEANLSADDPAARNGSLLSGIKFAKSKGVLFPTFCETIVAGKDGTGMQRSGDQYHEILSLLCDETCGCHPTFDDQPYTVRQMKGHFTLENLKTRTPGRSFQGLRKAYKKAMLYRRLCWTRGGRLGLVPRFAREDDELILIPGAAIPFVVRRRPDGAYILIGECYVHGIMDGSAMEDVRTPLSVLSLV